ncbi:hypothetical protein PMAYCL1PPCAC_27220, partial [Pristionchus mayeri]
ARLSIQPQTARPPHLSRAMSTMLSVVVFATLASISDCRVTFTHSEVLQETDLDKDNQAQFKCENGCFIYSDSRSEDMFITDGTTYMSNFLLLGTPERSTGHELVPWPKYTLVYRGEKTPPRFVFYAVDKKSADANTPVYVANSQTGYVDNFISADGKVFTLLRSFDPAPYVLFQGDFTDGYPRIYTTGYDAVNEAECEAAYTARSELSAYNSWITVDSPILTVVNGPSTAKTIAMISGVFTNMPSNSSVVYISPGYVGCSYNRGQLYSSSSQTVLDTFSANVKSIDITADLSIPTKSEAVAIAVNNEKIDLYGVDPFKKHFEAVKFDVTISWIRNTADSYFAIQFDLGVDNGGRETTIFKNVMTSTASSSTIETEGTSTTKAIDAQTTTTSAHAIFQYSLLLI